MALSTYPCGSEKVKYISYSPSHSARKPWWVCVPFLVRVFWTFPTISSFLCPFVQAPNKKWSEPDLESAKQRLTWIYRARLFFYYSVLCGPFSDCFFWTGVRSHDHLCAGTGSWDFAHPRVLPAGPCASFRPDLRSIHSSSTFRFSCRFCVSCDAGGSSFCASFCWRRPPFEFQPSLWSIHLFWFDRSVLAALFPFYAAWYASRHTSCWWRPLLLRIPTTPSIDLCLFCRHPGAGSAWRLLNPFGLSFLLGQVLVSPLPLPPPLPGLRLRVR